MAPLRHALFRRIWFAGLLSNLGLLIQGVGAAWSMTMMTSSADMVALVLTAALMPTLLISIAAGAIADMYDRRIVALIGLSMFGIGALLASSAGWLTLLKWLGGAYLVWLGVQVWRSPPIELDPAALRDVGAVRGIVLFRQGLLSALTNPKALLFFAAFLPQFVDPRRDLVLQFAVMAGTFAAIEIATEVFIAAGAQRLRPWLERVGRRFNQACGGLFVLIGAALPLRG